MRDAPYREFPGKSRLWTSEEEALRALDEGQITPGHARVLLMLPEGDRLWALSEILEKGLSVRQAERLGQRKRARPSPDPEYQALAEELSRSLGFRVHLSKKRLVIEFSSEEELIALLERLGYQR